MIIRLFKFLMSTLKLCSWVKLIFGYKFWSRLCEWLISPHEDSQKMKPSSKNRLLSDIQNYFEYIQFSHQSSWRDHIICTRLRIGKAKINSGKNNSVKLNKVSSTSVDTRPQSFHSLTFPVTSCVLAVLTLCLVWID